VLSADIAAVDSPAIIATASAAGTQSSILFKFAEPP
jgi:hypothetical protein